MTWHKELAGRLRGQLRSETGHYDINLTRAIVGIVAYMFILIPIFTLTVVGSLDLSEDYLIPVAVAWVFVGLYITDNHVCRHLH